MCGKMRVDKRLRTVFKFALGLLVLVLFVIFVFHGTKLFGHTRLKKENCPPNNATFVTVMPGGRLGNGIFEYLSAWALAKQTDAVPVVPNEILKQISGAFGELQIQSLEEVAEICDDFVFLESVVKNMDAFEGNRTSRYTVLPRLTVLRKYAFDWESLLPVWNELRLQLKFHPTLLSRSQAKLAEIKAKGNYTEFVAVHVRRTDYIKYIESYINATPAQVSYYLSAMAHMRKTLPTPPAFVVTSDDNAWCRQHLKNKDVFVVGDAGSPESDLALLSSCNHTIFAYGTFGMTVAMFNSDGQTIVYDTKSTDYYITHPFAKALSNWTMMSNLETKA